MFLDVLLDILLASAPRSLGNINLSRGGNGRKTSKNTLSPYAKRLGMVALVLAVACMARGSIAQGAKESIDVPPRSKLLLRAVGSGDQVYGCVNGRWVLTAPDAKLLNQEGSVIGRHFAGPTWELNYGSWVKGRAVAKQIVPDATAVPWLLLESVGGTGRLGTVRFIQRTGTHGEMRPTVVVARAQCVEFLTQLHIISMERGNNQKLCSWLEGRKASAAASILN
jgi:hypothetical protein